ncbi:MAG: rhomboid family intramembrane serine protease [Syntrophobacterales bacterium]|nr:MAG: rhomboid family intramembrane serine protease [Syntrophobacterales bacterium]
MDEPLASVTVLTVVATGIVSVLGFRDRRIVEAYRFDTAAVLGKGHYYRLFTAGLLHADWPHLLFNMFSLYSFARYIELFFSGHTFLLIYGASILGGNLLALLLHRNHSYRALGASGGVCGIIFASIFLLPGGGVRIFPIPLSIPSWLFAILFIIGSYAGMRSGKGNIGHDAHLGGAIIGLLVTTALYPRIVLLSPLLYAAVMGLSVLLMLYSYRRRTM